MVGGSAADGFADSVTTGLATVGCGRSCRGFCVADEDPRAHRQSGVIGVERDVDRRHPAAVRGLTGRTLLKEREVPPVGERDAEVRRRRDRLAEHCQTRDARPGEALLTRLGRCLRACDYRADGHLAAEQRHEAQVGARLGVHPRGPGTAGHALGADDGAVLGVRERHGRRRLCRGAVDQPGDDRQLVGKEHLHAVRRRGRRGLILRATLGARRGLRRDSEQHNQCERKAPQAHHRADYGNTTRLSPEALRGAAGGAPRQLGRHAEHQHSE